MIQAAVFSCLALFSLACNSWTIWMLLNALRIKAMRSELECFLTCRRQFMKPYVLHHQPRHVN